MDLNAIDIFAVIKQVDELDKNRAQDLIVALITAVKNGTEVPNLSESGGKVKDSISRKLNAEFPAIIDFYWKKIKRRYCRL